MKTAIQFGAGNIGRGFIGGLLSLAGYRVVFADIDSNIIDRLNATGEYKIVVVDEDSEVQTIRNVSGVHVNDESLMDVFEEAEIVTTAVGPVALPKIASTIAKGIKRRKEKDVSGFLNIIACENLFGASDSLKGYVLECLTQEEKEYCLKYIGFPNSVVDRIVPPGRPENEDILTVRVEPFFEWIVDELAFKGEIPNIEGMITTDNLSAFVERKLFTLNTGHAVTAYLGKALGYETIRSSINDSNIYNCVRKAMEESGAALVERYNFDKEAHNNYITKIINRFKNPYLDDYVDRVGREPIRKLSKTDRLIKPLRMAIGYGLEYSNLVIGVAAAFHFKADSDAQSVELQNMIKTDGIRNTVVKVTGLNDMPDVVDKIVDAYCRISDGKLF